VSDPAAARLLTFAYVRDGDVWASLHGVQPQQITHLGLGGQLDQLDWRLTWSADASRLLVSEASYVVGSARAWIVALPADTVTSVPASTLVPDGCQIKCVWLGDRYLVYADAPHVGPHSQTYHVYDTQLARELATTLDPLRVTEIEPRGLSLYFTPYAVAPTAEPGSIERFDLTGNMITPMYTTPGPLVGEGIPSGSWDLSADGRRAAVSFVVAVASHCPHSPCFDFYQDAAGGVSVLFPALQNANVDEAPSADIDISPDGSYAATVTGPSPVITDTTVTQHVEQQALPSGVEVANALPVSQQGYWLVGWALQQPGVVVAQTVVDGNGNPLATRVYYAPAGSSSPAVLVETTQAGSPAFASPGA
jgi:hypothetical protein